MEINKMNNTLSEYIQNSTGYNQTVIDSVIESFFKYVNISLRQGEEILLPNFGKFSTKDMPSRKGRNPRTGEVLTILPKRKPNFKFSKKFISEIQPEEIIKTVLPPKLPILPPPLPSKVKKWWVNLNQKTVELSSNELDQAGITPETLVWNQSLDGWKVAKDVPELGYLINN